MPLSVVLSAVMAFGVSMTSARRTYLGRNEQVDWNTAQDRCSSALGGKSAPTNHGQLATWSNSGDFGAIQRVGAQLGAKAWVGMSDLNKEGDWEMIDGATDYCAPDAPNPKTDCDDIDEWYPGQPDDVWNEDCAELYVNGELNDKECDADRMYICEWQDDLVRVVDDGERMLVAVRDYVTWPEAKAGCENFGGHLATWSNSGDYSAVQEAQKLAASNSWVGMHDLNQEGKWEMVDGATADYVEWNPNEPNNYGAGKEDCVEMYNNGKLNNNRCYDEQRYYICEFSTGTHKFASSDVLPQTPWVPADPVAVPRDFVIGTYSAQDLMVVALAVFLVINAVTLAVFCLRTKGTATIRYAKVMADSDA